MIANDFQRSGYYEKEFYFNIEKDKPRDFLENKSIAEVLVESDSGILNVLDFCNYSGKSSRGAKYW